MIPIHHMEAHALTPRLTNDLKFPYLAFLISGGHCMLALAKVKFTTAFANLKWLLNIFAIPRILILSCYLEHQETMPLEKLLTRLQDVYVRAYHMFLQILNFLFKFFFEKKVCVFFIKK